MTSSSEHAFEDSQFQEWLVAIALRIDELVQHDRVMGRFHKMLRNWQAEYQARAPKKRVSRNGSVLYHRDSELLPCRALTLPEKYLLLAAIHDAVCVMRKRIELWGTAKKIRSLPRAHQAIPFAVRIQQVSSISKTERIRVEETMRDVERDLEQMSLFTSKSDIAIFGIRNLDQGSFAATLMQLMIADDSGPSRRSATAVTIAEKRWTTLKSRIRETGAISVSEILEFEQRLHQVFERTLRNAKSSSKDLTVVSQLMDEERLLHSEIRKLADLADEIEKLILARVRESSRGKDDVETPGVGPRVIGQKSKRRPGRPPGTSKSNLKEDARIAKQWIAASVDGGCRTYADFAQSNNMKEADVRDAVERHRAREKRVRTSA